MPFHEYSRLFTSGLLSEPSSPPNMSSDPSPRRRRPPFLELTAAKSLKPVDSRTYSFLELVDSLASPVSPTDPSCPPRSLGRSTVSVATGLAAIRKPGLIRMRTSVLNPTLLNAAVSSPTTDSLSIFSISAGQSFLITDPPLPDSPTLTRGPSQRTIASRSASSASISVTSETKRVNRLAALACLEGRESSSAGIARKNFMSMSDDEEEDDSLASRSISTDPEVSRRLSLATASNISMLANGEKGEPLPSDILAAQSPQQSKMAPMRNRHRSRTMESWFPPLANFMDLRSEGDPPNWRSFIELSTATA